MLPPSDLFVHEDLGGVLCFRSENPGCAFWGVRLCDLGEADPPVVVQSREGWRPFMDRVSLACVELVISETLFSDGRLYNACELPADIAREVPRLFQRVALPDYPMWTGDDESPVRWFSAPGLLLRQDGLTADSWLHVRGRHWPTSRRPASHSRDGGPSGRGQRRPQSTNCPSSPHADLARYGRRRCD